MAEYSYLMLYLPRGMSRDAARRILTDHAEYGHWELSRMRMYPDGSRKATLRRRVIRQVRTPMPLGVMTSQARRAQPTGRIEGWPGPRPWHGRA
jgi:hypothetical protein